MALFIVSTGSGKVINGPGKVDVSVQAALSVTTDW